MSGGLMSCGLKSGGLMSGGLKSYDQLIVKGWVRVSFQSKIFLPDSGRYPWVGHTGALKLT